jgi:hypothetical protein
VSVLTTTLTVGGTSYAQAARKTNSMCIDAWGWDYDDGYWLEFHEHTAGPQPKFTGPTAVTLNDGTLRFTGDLTSCQPGMNDGVRTWGYRCLGLEYRASQIPVTAVDGSGTIVYDLPAEDEDYLASNSGLSLGTIVGNILTMHVTVLTAAGITTDTTTTAQLAALTLVPKDAVYVQGERLWPALQSVFQRFARNNRLWILPSGLVRVIDVTAGTNHSLTQGTDPIDPPLWARDWSHNATRVQTRGKGRIRPAYVSWVVGTLQRTWTDTDEANWNMAQFSTPVDAYDIGTVTSMLGPTSVRVQSSSGSRTWATNFWSGRQAWIHLRNDGGAVGLSYQEAAPVTANTALTAGGTSDISLGLTLDNSGTGAYDHYTMVGTIAPAGTTGALNNVYRLYNIVTPGNWIEHHLVKRFPSPQPFFGLNGQFTELTLTPTCLILGGSSAYPATFRIEPATGRILFDRPTVEQLNSASTLATGGTGVVKPVDIRVMLAYSRGALTAVYPPDVSGAPAYAGTAYTVAGLARTRVADVESWLYEGDETTMTSLAQMIHGSISDTIIEGTVRYKGFYSAVFDADGGHRVTTVEPKLPSGSVSTTVPIRGVTVRYITGGGGLLYQTDMKCSSRRDPRTDESMYLHLCQFGTGGSAIAGGYNPYGVGQLTPGEMAGMGPAGVSMPTTGGGNGYGGGGDLGRGGGNGNVSGRYAGRRKRRGLTGEPRPDPSRDDNNPNTIEPPSNDPTRGGGAW